MSDVSRRDLLRVAVGAIGAAVGAALVGPSVRAADAAGHLSSEDIIRAWKDEEFRQSLSDAQRAQLPNHPAGTIEMSDVEGDESWALGPSRTFGGGVCNRTCKFPCCLLYTCSGGR